MSSDDGPTEPIGTEPVIVSTRPTRPVSLTQRTEANGDRREDKAVVRPPARVKVKENGEQPVNGRGTEPKRRPRQSAADGAPMFDPGMIRGETDSTDSLDSTAGGPSAATVEQERGTPEPEPGVVAAPASHRATDSPVTVLASPLATPQAAPSMPVIAEGAADATGADFADPGRTNEAAEHHGRKSLLASLFKRDRHPPTDTTTTSTTASESVGANPDAAAPPAPVAPVVTVAPVVAGIAATALILPATRGPLPPAVRQRQVGDFPLPTRMVPASLPGDAPTQPRFVETNHVGPELIAPRTRPVRTVAAVGGRRPRIRRVTRVIRHVDPWSVFKVAICFSTVLYGVCLTTAVLLWNVAYTTGTIDNIERFFESFGWDSFQFNGGQLYHNVWIAGLFAVIGLTGLIVLGATLFNLITDLVGGIRVTVLEEEVVERDPANRRTLRRGR